MDQMKTGRFIAQLRNEKGLTQQTLGDAIGVTNKTVSRWENGVYMPDIDTLALLAKTFDVTINELLCGERLSDEQFRKEADANLVALRETTAFTVREETAFWKKKWIKENTVTMIICVLTLAGVLTYAWIRGVRWIISAAPLLSVILYAALHNSMMAYIENKLYGKIEEKAK